MPMVPPTSLYSTPIQSSRPRGANTPTIKPSSSSASGHRRPFQQTNKPTNDRSAATAHQSTNPPVPRAADSSPQVQEAGCQQGTGAPQLMGADIRLGSSMSTKSPIHSSRHPSAPESSGPSRAGQRPLPNTRSRQEREAMVLPQLLTRPRIQLGVNVFPKNTDG